MREHDQSEVLESLETVQQAIARAPLDEAIARHHGIRTAIGTAVTAVTTLLGWKAFSDFSARTGHDFMRVGAVQKGQVLTAGVQINTGNIFQRLAQGAEAVFTELRAPGALNRVGSYFVNLYRKSPKTFGITAGGIAALSVGAGVIKYLRARNQARDARFREIGHAVHTIADHVREHPELLDDGAIGKALKERISEITAKPPGTDKWQTAARRGHDYDPRRE